MNQVFQIGRITADVEARTTGSGVSVCTFSLAVQRRFPDANGEYLTDFHKCVAWRNTAEFLRKHAYKGQKIAIVGSLQNRSYNAQDGTKRYVTEIVVDNVELLERKDESGGSGQNQQTGGGYAQNQQGDSTSGRTGTGTGSGGGYTQTEFVQVEDDELPF